MKNFFAYLNRMKYIKRWSLMHSIQEENILEHSAQVAHIANALAVIKNTYFEGNIDINKITTIALYHEASEVITGDLPTPIKYLNTSINLAYKEIEQKANQKLIEDGLTVEMQDYYKSIIMCEKEEYILVKFADKISAYIKCVEELKSGNKEFNKAKNTIKKELDKIEEPAVQYFIENYLDAYSLSLDDLSIDL
ncbi:MAG: 5'-deoxynucleotidase [Clostridia bacterium]